MAFKSHFAVFFLALAVGLPQPVRADQDASAVMAAQQSALPIIIGALADYKTFRMSSAQLDAAVTLYCTKTGNRMRKTMIISEYKCKPGSGITDIRIDSREGMGNPLPNYMMSVVLNFVAEDFSVVRSIMEKKLGRPKKSTADYVEWHYLSDKALNENGNPVINLSRIAHSPSATFQLALEQGS